MCRLLIVLDVFVFILYKAKSVAINICASVFCVSFGILDVFVQAVFVTPSVCLFEFLKALFLTDNDNLSCQINLR